MRYLVTEIAAACELSPGRIRQLITELGLKPEKRGGALIFTSADLRKIAGRKTKPGPGTKRGNK